jgi:hypothetical protein
MAPKAAAPRAASAPAGLIAFVAMMIDELTRLWARGKGKITWPDFKVFAPNPTFKLPTRVENLKPEEFKAHGSVVSFWAPHMFWRWVRVPCPCCLQFGAVEPQGWGKIRRVMGLVPHYLVPYRYKCKGCPGARVRPRIAGSEGACCSRAIVGCLVVKEP